MKRDQKSLIKLSKMRKIKIKINLMKRVGPVYVVELRMNLRSKNKLSKNIKILIFEIYSLIWKKKWGITVFQRENCKLWSEKINKGKVRENIKKMQRLKIKGRNKNFRKILNLIKNLYLTRKRILSKKCKRSTQKLIFWRFD